MGSLSADLNLPESLRVWYQAGVHMVYAPGFVPAQPAVATPHAAPANAQPAQARPRQAVPQPKAPVQPSQPGTPATAHSSPEAHAEKSSVQKPDLPAPWDGYWNKVAPGSKVIITYMDLGKDLGGAAEPKRGRLFRSLLSHLRWPKGTASFWPMSALSPEGLTPNSELFWAGVKALGIRTVACFGDDALSVIMPGSTPGKEAYVFENQTVLSLPHPDTLIPMLPHEQHEQLNSLFELSLGD